MRQCKFTGKTGTKYAKPGATGQYEEFHEGEILQVISILTHELVEVRRAQWPSNTSQLLKLEDVEENDGTTN